MGLRIGAEMSTSTRLTFEDFERLPEREGIVYELDEGELLMEPSPTFLHNRIRDRIARQLAKFVADNRLGEITVEMDFRLGPETVRNPDVAFVTNQHLKTIDVNRSPVDGAPELAIEVISPNNLAQDTLKRVSQFLGPGAKAVWVVYPALRLIEVHKVGGSRQVRAPESLIDEVPFGPGFSLSLAYLF